MKPWAQGPFELIRHAEEHARNGSGFDQRMALISFDNAIEVAIFTYLSLSPFQRGNQEFSKEQVKKWLSNFHSKLEFLEHLVTQKLSQPMQFERDEIVFYHNLRNELYHERTGLVPDGKHVNEIRAVSLWVFRTLFDTDAESLLAQTEETETGLNNLKSDYVPGSAVLNDLSDQTKFLESFISMRHDLNMLMHMVSGVQPEHKGQLPPREVWKRISSAGEALTPVLGEVLERAEALHTQILEGDSDPDESTVREVSRDLASVTDLIESQLRTFQHEIVEKALDATSRAATGIGARRAGIVWQSPGTGITTSLISYVGKVQSMKAFDNPLIIIASNLNSLVEQTYQRFTRSAGSLGSSVERVTDTARLLNILESGEKKIVLTTIQRILRISSHGPFKRDDILFVGQDLYGPAGIINRAFPNAVFILFTNAFLPTDEMNAAYGELIARYDLSQAINDQVTAPVHYENRAFASPGFLEDVGNDLGEEFTKSIASIDYIRAVAADLISHFEGRSAISPERALIVTRSINLANVIFSTLSSLRPEWTQDIIGPINGALDWNQRQALFSRLADQEDKVKIALISSQFLVGLNIPNLKTVYVLEALSPNILMKAIGILRRSFDKKVGLIVDYGGNLSSIQSLLSEIS